MLQRAVLAVVALVWAHAAVVAQPLDDSRARAGEWDPRGATGYAYNHEAGMPYAYWFSRAYTFLHAHVLRFARVAG